VPNLGPIIRAIPPGDDRERLTCPDCGFIAYENPKMVAGSVVSVGDRIMLCRRAIEPRKGFWTLPAGFLELQETPEEGARREAWEEARARIAIDALLAVYSVPRISQVQLIYRATLAEPGFAAGPEKPGSRSVRLGRHSLDRTRLPVGEVGIGRISGPAGTGGLRAWGESTGHGWRSVLI
jgi:ADP-ribose pyrophosphatase YjhB (NUDIX family)